MDTDTTSSSTDSSSSGSWYLDTDTEHPKYYRMGGYHPVKIGDLYNDRYRIAYKLGWGYYSMVWLAWDYTDKKFKSLKIQKSSKMFKKAAEDEIDFNEYIGKDMPSQTPICNMTDKFIINGTNGEHWCMVFETLGSSLDYVRRKQGRMEIDTVRKIINNVMEGLRYLRSKNIIHTDIKSDNILLTHDNNVIQTVMGGYKIPPKEIILEENFSKSDVEYVAYKEEDIGSVKIIDFGNACYADKQYDDTVQVEIMMAPEVILGCKYDMGVDVWSLGCIAYEMITGDILFDCDGSKYDACSDDSDDGLCYNENHLANIVELLGPIPTKMITDGSYSSRYMYANGKFKNIKNLQPQSLSERLSEYGHWNDDQIREICDMLLPLLTIDPMHRLK